MNTNHNPYEASKRMPVGTRLTIDGIEGEIVRGYGCNQCSLNVNTCNFCCSGNKRPDKADVVFVSDADKLKQRQNEAQIVGL